MSTPRTASNSPEKKGNAYRWRVDARGTVFEYVGLGIYEKRLLDPQEVSAVGIAPRNTFLAIGKAQYALVHDCVLTTACKHCDARPGERCHNNGLRHSSTHWVRRAAYRLVAYERRDEK